MQDTNINNSLTELENLLEAGVLTQEEFENGKARLLSSSEEIDDNNSINADVEEMQVQVVSTKENPQRTESVSPAKKSSSLRFWFIYVLLLILLVVFVVKCNDNKTAPSATESTNHLTEVMEVEDDSFVDETYKNVPKLLQHFRDAFKNETPFRDFLSTPEVKSWIINTKSQSYYDKMNQWICEYDPITHHITKTEEGVYEISCEIRERLMIALEYNTFDNKMSVSMKVGDIELDSNGDNPVIKEIKAQAIPFRDVMDAFNNPVKAEQTLLGKTLYIEAEIDEIVRINNENYKYLLKSEYSLTGKGHLKIYTNDELFVTFDYPKTIIIQAYFKNRHVSRDFFTGNIDDIYYNFLDGKAAVWRD